MKWATFINHRTKEKYLTYLKFIERQIKTPSLDNKVALLTGDIASTLFWQYQKNAQQTEVNPSIIKGFNKAFEQVKNQAVPYNFIDGLAGLGWTYSYVCRNGNFQEDINATLEELDQIILTIAIADLKANNYDFFYGGIGYGLYFLERLKTTNKAKEALETILFELNRKAITKEDYIYWQSEEDKESTIVWP